MYPTRNGSTRRWFAGMATVLVASTASAQTLLDGYLCCNMRSDARGWITDINYLEQGKHLVPAGIPVKMVGYGRNRFEFAVAGAQGSLPRTNYWIGNDYSRSLGLEAFAARFIVKDDPATKIASYPARIADAIKAQRVAVGMTKEQVLMAIGPPIADETPNLSGPWKYWYWSFSPFTLHFAGDRVEKIESDPETLGHVMAK